MSAEVPTKPLTAVASEQRTIGRLGFWWFPKVSPALALAYCASLVFGDSGWATMRSVAVVAFVGLCVGTYGYLVNDIFDIEVDLRAGKRNRMVGISPLHRFLFCAGALALGFVPALVVPTSERTLLVLGIEYGILTIYSMPPFRVKSRGFLGMLCDCSGSHLGASLYTLSVVADGRTNDVSQHAPGVGLFVGVVLVWQLCLGLTGILIHQVEDRENDILSVLPTFASKRTFAEISVPMSYVNAGEWLAFAGLCLALIRVAPLLALAALAYSGLLALKLWHRWAHYRRVEEQSTLIEWWQLSHPFYEAYFPLAAAIQCAWIHPQIALVVPLHLAVFISALRQQLRDTRGAWTQLLLGARLDVTETASARLRPVLFPRRAHRIDIRASGTEAWEIRAARPKVELLARQTYQIVLTIRAKQPRTITFGVWQDHAPWQDLGLVEQMPLTESWLTISRDFTANSDDAEGYLGLWLGGQAGAVEVQHWSVRPVMGMREN
jgi:4-hydroxybenzoate polyprenyltransferase